MPEERLQKIIAAAGITSRRKAEELITQGRVTVNGQVVTQLGSKADPQKDHIKVDGKLLLASERHVYLLLNKPKGYVTTVSDPEGRPTVMDLVKHVGERIYPVGRLDYSSEGLLILTNDGELANYLTRAESHVPKHYLVKISGRAPEEEIEKLRQGIRIGSRPGTKFRKAVHTAPAEIRLVKEAENPWYEVTLIEGKNRQIRRMFEEIGHHVEKIKRVSYGPLTLDVEPGQFRELQPAEISALRRAGTAKPRTPSGKKFIGDARPQRGSRPIAGRAEPSGFFRKRFRDQRPEGQSSFGASRQRFGRPGKTFGRPIEEKQEHRLDGPAKFRKERPFGGPKRRFEGDNQPPFRRPAGESKRTFHHSPPRGKRWGPTPEEGPREGRLEERRQDRKGGTFRKPGSKSGRFGPARRTRSPKRK